MFSLVLRVHAFFRYGIGEWRIKILKLIGLKAGKKVFALPGIRWPLRGLKDITIGNNTTLGFNGWFAQMREGAKITIGSGTNIGDQFMISADSPVQIGDECLFSYRVSVMAHRHIFGEGINPVTSGYAKSAPIVIGNRCFIGCNAVILAGVTLGDHCTVGANSVVTGSFPAGSVVGGAPARLLNRKPDTLSDNQKLAGGNV
jgi:acetyltransferase-like isoleucine patch superfamily enzyme